MKLSPINGATVEIETPNTLNYKRLEKKRAFTISVASGKGGVGKTLTSIQLACSLARMGKKVLLLDGDLGLANVDIVLGLKPRYNITDVIYRGIEFKDILIEGPSGIMIAPASSGISSVYRLSLAEQDVLINGLRQVMDEFDFVLIDNGAGITDSVTQFSEICDCRLVVTTPEPHAIADAYALVKVLKERKNLSDFSFIINMVLSDQEGRHVFERIRRVAESFLGSTLNYLGSVPFDPRLQDAVIARDIGNPQSKYTISGQSFHALGSRLSDLAKNTPRTDSHSFWQSFLSKEAQHF